MPNGTGKTTIIELLQGILTGEARNWSADKIGSYKAKDDTVYNGEFDLTISIQRDNEHNQEVVFRAEFDFVHGSVEFFTKKDVHHGQERGWAPPKDLKQYITSSCVEVFIFKGDKVKDIISPDKDDAETTIKAFFGIEGLDNFVSHIKKNFQYRINNLTVNNNNVESERTLYQYWNDRHSTLVSKLDEFKEKLNVAKHKQQELEEKWGNILSEQENALEKQQEIDEKQQEAEAELYDKAVDVFGQLKNPFTTSQRILNNLVEMRDGLDRMKLPGASRTFFEELIEDGNNCICGRELDNDSVKTIESNIESYLSNNEINIINDIKRSISDAYSGDGHHYLKKSLEELNELYVYREDVTNEKNRFERIAVENSGGEGQKIFNEYTESQSDVIKYENAIKTLEKDTPISDLDESRPDSCKSHVAAEKMCDKLSERIGEMSDLLQDVDANKTLVSVLEIARKSSLSVLKDHLKDLTNRKMRETLPEGSKIEIIDIDKSLQLGWNGVRQDEGSGAQNIIVAYSFARSVLEEASIEFPMIVDHPVTQVDRANRKALGSQLASMMHQFVGFLIDTERGGFIEGLEEESSVHYISLFSNIKGNEKYIESMKKVDKDEVLITDNGYLCYNKNFFIENSMGNV